MFEKILLIVFLCIFLLKPDEIKVFTKNIFYFYSNINKYINFIKSELLKIFKIKIK